MWPQSATWRQRRSKHAEMQARVPQGQNYLDRVYPALCPHLHSNLTPSVLNRLQRGQGPSPTRAQGPSGRKESPAGPALCQLFLDFCFWLFTFLTNVSQSHTLLDLKEEMLIFMN